MRMPVEIASRAAMPDEDWPQRLQGFIASKLNSDGGFANRAGHSDPYYTFFGISCLLAGRIPIMESTADYVLKNASHPPANFAHLAALTQSAAVLNVQSADNGSSCPVPGASAAAVPKELTGHLVGELEGFRSQDGGYSHISKCEANGSAYAAYLSLQAYGYSGLAVPYPEKILKSLAKLRLPDGSYSNSADQASGGTLATAAAVVAVKSLGGKTDDASCGWLLRQACPQGGFSAFENTGMPDLLSTAAALFALKSCGCELRSLKVPVTEFVQSLRDLESGGFRGFVFDTIPDVEYTFYALLSLGALAD